MSGQIHLYTVVLAGFTADGTHGLLMEKVIKAGERARYGGREGKRSREKGRREEGRQAGFLVSNQKEQQ